ncbi:putative virion structural protein [Erwinia phage vB_EamM_Simmy50]|uniref:Putative virion structural protein n=1 Tax=Erwinia phage vB_EamM_Simmy50 TaxID=1815988 RepID=A0A173GCT0_9CAUD|nr:virion structural protein [Erwinia phage vB_EamM_Simmy50]ANH51472.1 putative virion structural protein [Erwinia phage vB_EamM_Simmy50]
MLQRILQKTANEIIVEPFNLAFNTNLKAANFELKDVGPATGGKDTQATLSVIDTTSGYKGERPFTYNRLDATELFYGVPKFFPMGSADIDEYSVVGMLALRYGLKLDINHIANVTITAGKAVVTFADSSPIIKGSVQFDFYDEAIDLEELIADPEIGVLEMPERTEKPNVTYYSYAYDMTYCKAFVPGMAVGSLATQELADAVANITGDPWVLVDGTTTEYNLAGAELVYNGNTTTANAQGYPVNDEYAMVALFKLTDSCNNFSGLLMVNMN